MILETLPECSPRIFAQRAYHYPAPGAIEIRIGFVELPSRALVTAHPLTFTKTSPDDAPCLDRGPTLALDGATARQLMDELWRCGVRPSEDNTPKEGTLQAMGNHLEDLRALVFKTVPPRGEKK